MVFSFGDTGELIHPRFDSRAPLRIPGVGDQGPVEQPVDTAVATKPEAVSEAEVAEPISQPEDPGVAPIKGKDLAERLDSLLDPPKS